MPRKLAILVMLGAVVLALTAPVAFAQEEELGLDDLEDVSIHLDELMVKQEDDGWLER